MALTQEQTKRLEALRNYPTRYEIEVVRPDGEKRLLSYTPYRSGPGLRRSVVSHGKDIRDFLGVDLLGDWKPIRGCAMHTHLLNGGGVIRFTGRTQREAIQSGEELVGIGRGR